MTHFLGKRLPVKARARALAAVTALAVSFGLGAALKDSQHITVSYHFDPHAFYAYRLDPAAAVPALVARFSGPQKDIDAG